MATMTADGKKKFGSSMVAKKYDAFHPKEQEKFDSYDGGEQPKMESTSREHGGDKVNSFSESEAHDNPRDTQSEVETPSSVVEKHGPAHTVIMHHGDDGVHTVTSLHPDNHAHASVHSSAAEAHEAGGDLAWVGVKEHEHKPQQSASSEEMNFEAPETA
jgi:hypothetical protein